MTFAPATPADLDALWRLGCDCFAENAWTLENWRQVLDDPGHLIWIAHDATPGGGLVAYLVLHLAGEEADLEWIAVTPALRRQGLAARLLNAAFEDARARGVHEIFLEVRSRNFAARDFYRRHGFAMVGARPGYYRQPADDAVIMHRAIGATAPSRP